MPYSDYLNGLIKSQSTFSSGSEISKITAINTITGSTLVTIPATILINTAVLILTSGTFTSIQFPSIASIIAALNARSYTVTNGIIIDIILVNLTDHPIAILTNDLLDPVGLGATTIGVNHVHSYKIISDVVGGATTFRIYLISGGEEGEGKDVPNVTLTSVKTAVGVDALSLSVNPTDNTAIGYNALGSNQNGTFNTAIGHLALQTPLNENSNTAIGSSLICTVGQRNTLVGYNIDASNRNDCIVLGRSNNATYDPTGDGQFVVNAGAVVTEAVTVNNSWKVKLSDGNDYYINLEGPI